ncbi:hypothetical protein [Streptomyces sp. NPDC102462]|uniref:hypothetical protein n=1 Tax=Streptomyces sp. NPDC102462 TaxID=3366178 RepID=UPI0038208160
MTYAGALRRGRRASAVLVCAALALLAGCSGEAGNGAGPGAATPSATGDGSAGSGPANGGTANGDTANGSTTDGSTANGGAANRGTDAGAQAGQSGTGADAAGSRFRADAARLPETRSQALRLLRTVTAGPDSYGPGYERRTPYESDPADWPVLGPDCVWRQASLPADVLGSLTRYARLPAGGGRGEVRAAATVTVHRTAAQADGEMAETLEEALRCPDQQLRATERIRGLNSIGSGYGTNGNTSADDVLLEMGEYLNPGLGKEATPYFWDQVRLGPVTIAVVVEGGKGYAQGDLLTAQARAVAAMETKVRSELGAGK